MPVNRFKYLYRQTVWALAAIAMLSIPSSALFYHRLNQEKESAELLTQIRKDMETLPSGPALDKLKTSRDDLIYQRERRERGDLILSVVAVGSLALLLWLLYQSAKDMKAAFNKAEAALEIEEAALERERSLSAAKSRIIQTISHEYRTPLATIATATELLQIPTLAPDKRQKYFEQIRGAVKRLDKLVEEVLTVFQFDAEAVPMNPVAIDLPLWFRGLASSTGEGDRIVLDIQVTELRADESLFYKIFSNLVGNALKYSDSAVLVQVTPILDGVLFVVADKGRGIPHSLRLFQAFERGSNVGVVSGTGLGLSIVKKAVDLAGGTIRIESQEGKGTEVRVVLPR